MTRLWVIAGLIACTAAAAQDAPDTSPHKIQFVTVDLNVKLEVLDWGGDGPPLVFLSGLGNTAHDFDTFAPRFIASHHVYGITRRGFGASDKPAPTTENYDVVRLADDVLAVLTALKLAKPVLAGHSIAGQEMSDIALRHPEAVSGLVYIDAGYEYAFYNAAFDDGSTRYGADVNLAVLERALDELPRVPPAEARVLIPQIQTIAARLGKSLVHFAPQDEIEARAKAPAMWEVVDAVGSGERRHTVPISVPVLALFAAPTRCEPHCGTADAKIWDAETIRSADAFEAGNPRARVLRYPRSRHAIWKSNEADVEREMDAFLATLGR